MKDNIELLPGEIIKDVAGFEGRFMVTSFGRMFSINGKWKGIKEMSPCKGYGGYLLTNLRWKDKNRKVRIHTIVAESFLKKESWHACVNHIDGNPSNNNVSNIEWTDNAGNVRHAIETGLFDTKGEKHHNSKLTKEKVLEMRRIRNKYGLPYSEIGKMFGVCRRQASDVVRGVNWGWI